MKIADLISNYPLPFVGGAEACVHHLATRQTRMGHQVKVVSPARGGLPALDYEVLPIWPSRARFAVWPILNRLFVKELDAYQRHYKFDIWQVTIGHYFGVASADYFAQNGIPSVLRCSGEDIQTEPLIGYGQRLDPRQDNAIRRTYPMFDGAISIVRDITEQYLAIGIPEEKIYYVPNGINKKNLNILPDRITVNKKYGIGADKRIILTVGRYNPKNRKKGFHYIPDIILQLLRKRDDFVWILIGNKNDMIKREARKKGVDRFLIADEIRAKDPEDFPPADLALLYKSADVFAYPTLIEGGSNVISEAMASGLPIVSTDAPGVRDIVKDSVTGLLSVRKEHERMAENIDLIFNDAKLRARLKENSLRQTKDLDWSTVTDMYLGVYEDVIRRKKR